MEGGMNDEQKGTRITLGEEGKKRSWEGLRFPILKSKLGSIHV